jgi:hypothetical protein
MVSPLLLGVVADLIVMENRAVRRRRGIRGKRLAVTSRLVK